MRKLRMKALAVGGLLTASALVLALSPPRLGTERFQVEKTDIQEDLAGIEQHRAEVANLKEQKKVDKKADDKMAVIVDRKLIKKAKADLKRDKAYLRADKKDLKQDYRLVIREQKAEKKASQKELSDAKKELRSEIREGDGAGVEQAAQGVATALDKHEAEEAALADLRDDRNVDMIAVNDAISESDGQFAGSLAVESGFLHTREWAMR